MGKKKLYRETDGNFKGLNKSYVIVKLDNQIKGRNTDT